MSEEHRAKSEDAPRKPPSILAVLTYLFCVFALPPIGYYATLATFGLSSEGMGTALFAWLCSFSAPGFFKRAKKPIVIWQVVLLMEVVPLLGYLFSHSEPINPQVRLTRLAIEAVLTPMMVWYGLRFGSYMVDAERPTIQPEEPRNQIHRISPEPQPEDVVNVSQK